MAIRQGKSTTRRNGKAKLKEPHDWADYLRPLVLEMETGLEIVRRLRRACDLAREPPKPTPVRTDAIPSGPSNVRDRRWALRTPEELAALFSEQALRGLLREWEAELAEWARPLFKARGETLRMRDERADYLDAEKTWPQLRKAEAHRLIDTARERLNEMATSKDHSAGEMRLLVCADNPEEEVPPEVLEEFSRPAPDERYVRWLLNGSKKARGGVRDIDERLLVRPVVQPLKDELGAWDKDKNR